MARPDSQTTCWQCNKPVGGQACGGGNVISQAVCRKAGCGQERGRGDYAMSIMDEVLGVFRSRDDVDYDEAAASVGAVNLGTAGVFYDSPYRPAPPAPHGEEKPRLSRIGRCYKNE